MGHQDIKIGYARVSTAERRPHLRGMTVAKARGRLKGHQPTLTAAQQRPVIRLMDEGEHSPAKIGELFGVSRQTVYRVAAKARRQENAA